MTFRDSLRFRRRQTRFGGDVAFHEHDAEDITGGTFSRVRVAGDIWSENWGGGVPADLSSGPAISAEGFYIDSSAGAIQAMGDVWFGGDVTLLDDNARLRLGSSGQRIELRRISGLNMMRMFSGHANEVNPGALYTNAQGVLNINSPSGIEDTNSSISLYSQPNMTAMGPGGRIARVEMLASSEDFFSADLGVALQSDIPGTESRVRVRLEGVYLRAGGVDKLTAFGNFIEATVPYHDSHDVVLEDRPRGKLGYVQRIANITGLGAGPTDLTGLSVTVTLGANRLIRVTGSVAQWDRSGTLADGDLGHLRIHEGSTQLRAFAHGWFGNSAVHTAGTEASVMLTHSAGSHTYKLVFSRGNGSHTTALIANSSAPAYILVEDLGAA